MNGAYIFTKLENGTLLNEDSLRTEVHELGDCLIWACPSSGFYDDPCDLIMFGEVEIAETDSHGATILRIQTVAESLLGSAFLEQFKEFDFRGLCDQQFSLNREQLLTELRAAESNEYDLIPNR